MKINILKYSLWGAMVGLMALSSCTKLTDGFSTDPVNITDPSVISTFKFLSGAQVNLIGAFEGDVNRTTGMWVGYFSGADRQYIGLSNYAVSGRDFDVEWGAIYSSVLENDRIIKTKARFEKNYRVLGIVQTMDAMALGLAADLWGDVPYTEATQYPKITQPKYDAQADVYKAVQVILDSAITNLAKPVSSILVPSDADIFFGGDAAAWTEVANTLKARYYLHVRDYTNAVKYAANGISSPGGNMLATHGSSYQQNFNLFYSFLVYDRPGYMGADSKAPNLLNDTIPGNRNNAKTLETGRLNYYYQSGGIYTSTMYEPNYLVDFDWGIPTEYNGFFGATHTFPLVTYEENQLIKAESYVKMNDAANGLNELNTLRQYYRTGAQFGESTGYIAYGVQYDDYVMSDFNSGGIENADGINPNQALLREILEERYVTLIGQLEGFVDVGRTNNFLGLKPTQGHNQLPMRLFYPQSEVTTNPNTPQGVDIFAKTPLMESVPY